MRKSGKLVPLDTRLQANSDGSFSPRAAEVGVRFSGGGDGPLATVTRDGRSMSWGWPTPLPKPTVDGDSVTYSNVLDGVDLRLRAGSAGFGQLLVVKSAKAAANPALENIKLPLTTKGLKATTDEHGNLRAVNPAGQEVFTAPTPMMWDSTQPLAARSLEAAPASPTGQLEAPYGAQRAAMGVDLSGGTLALTPDSEVLKGANTTYPVYIDPSVSGSREAWAIAYSSAPGTAFYNGNGWNEGDGNKVTSYARVGNPGDGTSRSFFRMDADKLWSTDKVISSSTFRIKNSYSYSCTKREVQAWLTGAISSSTTWNHQPSWAQKLDAVSAAKGWSSGCPAGNLAFDVTSAAKKAASKHWHNITLGLRAATESDKYAYKRFTASSAVLSTTYNTVPNAPTNLDTAPSTKNSSGCGDVAPHGLIGNTDVYLTAKVSDKDGGTVTARFHLWATGHHSDGPGVFFIKTVSVTSGTVARVKVPKSTLSQYLSVADGNFSWKAQADDGKAKSDWTPTQGAAGCRFVFDPNRPSTPPTVASTQFPDGNNGWPVGTSSVRTEGTFTLSSSGVDDVTKYEYWTDTDPTVRTASPSSAGGSADVKFTPTSSGANRLYARSLDKAGNKSDTAVYLFYANGLKQPDKTGDINGDGNADLYGVAKDGTLNRFYGAGDGTVTKASSPASTVNWTGTQITHRGDWTGDGYEDLIALKHDDATGTDRLWIHPNTGYGFACSECAGTEHDQQELTVYDDADNHWKNGAKQILAVGDVDGPLDTDNDGVPDVPAHPDLIVNDGTFIWLYYGSSDNSLDLDRAPVLLAGPDDPIASGDSKVSEVTLAAPGDWNGDGQADLVVRYDRPDVGGLFVFHGKEDDNGYDISVTDRTEIGYNWSTDTVPMFTAAPDADNSGKLDLWATTPNSGRLRIFRDVTASDFGTVSAASDAFADYQSIG